MSGGTAVAPRISLQVDSSRSDGILPRTLPFQLVLTIRREADSSNESCVIKWGVFEEGFNRDGFVLLQETESGLERVDLAAQTHVLKSTPASTKDTIKVTRSNQVVHNLRELAPGESFTFNTTLPDHFQSNLKSGQTYRLQWAGGDISHWCWGSLETLEREEAEITHCEPDTAIQIPADKGFAFTVTEEADTWSGRHDAEQKFGFGQANVMEYQWRAEQDYKQSIQSAASNPTWPPEVQSDRGAPKFTTALDMPDKLELGKPFNVNALIKLHREHPGTKPVIFHTQRIGDGCFSVARREPGSSKENEKHERAWRPLEVEDACGGFWSDGEPDVKVSVAEHKDFVLLRPGESWTYTFTPYYPPWRNLADDLATGDQIRVSFDGAELDWWVWGDEKDHQETHVMLPSYVDGDVIQSKDDAKLPTSRISASDRIEVSVVGENETK